MRLAFALQCGLKCSGTTLKQLASADDCSTGCNHSPQHPSLARSLLVHSESIQSEVDSLTIA